MVYTSRPIPIPQHCVRWTVIGVNSVMSRCATCGEFLVIAAYILCVPHGVYMYTPCTCTLEFPGQQLTISPSSNYTGCQTQQVAQSDTISHQHQTDVIGSADDDSDSDDMTSGSDDDNDDSDTTSDEDDCSSTSNDDDCSSTSNEDDCSSTSNEDDCSSTSNEDDYSSTSNEDDCSSTRSALIRIYEYIKLNIDKLRCWLVDCCVSRTSGLNETEIAYIISLNKKHISIKLGELEAAVKAALEKFDLKDVYSTITSMHPECLNSLRHDINLLVESDVHVLVTYIKKLGVWTVEDISSMEILVKHYCPEQLSMIEEYKEQLTGFYAVIKLILYIARNPDVLTLETGYTSDFKYYTDKQLRILADKLEVGLRRFTIRTLKYIHDLWMQLGQYYLPPLTVVLDRILGLI